ncbi:MAG: A/G-specific adenine glycosylase [Gemmatimonadales bacterium]
MPPKSNLGKAAFRGRLTRWFRRAGRDLPWRRTRDPYHVVVSEVMLQQTQVARVLDYYPAFLERYPSIQHLAAARPRAVREAWDGLGYYRRAENLHRMAKTVVREHEGRVPSSLDVLRRLPGIGPYTAGAVACFAYEQATPAVDTNVARVLRRVFGTARKTHDKTREKTHRTRGTSESRRLRDLAASLQPRRGRAAWTFNQALMELGALVCTARKPNCEACPVRVDCAWYQEKCVISPK